MLKPELIYVTGGCRGKDRSLEKRLQQETASHPPGNVIPEELAMEPLALDKWAYENGVTLDFSRPGKPMDNVYIESFNGRFRDECLNTNWFLSLEDAKKKIEAWRKDYNESRPHMSLDYMTPLEFASYTAGLPGTEGFKNAGDSLYAWT